MENNLFIDACFGRKTDRTPVWMMRQAGRYLPQYRAVREKHTFTEMCKTPELAVEVTLQPVDLLAVDAAILFSDILVIPEAMGMALEFHEGKGPLLPVPVRTGKDIDRLVLNGLQERLDFVFKAIGLLRRELFSSERDARLSGTGKVPLIGFSGAPFTLATYMVEGSASKNFKQVKTLRFARPDLFERLMDKITQAVGDYCLAQIESGAQVIQLFDTWAGLLDAPGFETFALPRIKEIITRLKPTGVPVIYFAKGMMHALELLTQTGADVLGLDWTIFPREACKNTGGIVSLQGNLDPTALYAPPAEIRKLVREMLKDFSTARGHIANLGHGILPDIPVDHAQAFIDSVKEESQILTSKDLS